MTPEDRYPDWLDADRRLRRLRWRPPTAGRARPWLSVVILLETPSCSRLAAAVASLTEQTASGLEVVLGWRGALAPGLAALVHRWEAQGRVRTAALAPELPRAEAWPQLLAAARGEWVALAGAHDRFEPDFLAELFAASSAADVLIADDDVLNVCGDPREPSFNSGWDPDLALARPPRGIFAVRRELLQAGGAPGPETAGEEAWDVLLRASAGARPGGVRVVPAVLRHGEATPLGASNWAGARVVEAHLRRTGAIGCTVEEAGERRLRVRRPLPSPAPLASLIIPTRERADLLRRCLEGVLQRTSYPALEVLVIDNGSEDPETLALFRTLVADPRVRVLPAPGPFDWAALNAAGVRAIRGEIAVLLNNDTEVIGPEWLEELVAQALRPDVGVVGAKLLYPDGSVQHAGVLLNEQGRGIHMWRGFPGDAPGQDGQLLAVREVTAVTGACMALRREVWDAVGGLAEGDLAVTWNDVDLCLRARAAGYRVLWTPYAVLTHIELATRGADRSPEARARVDLEHAYMRRAWGADLQADSSLSPRLDPNEGTPTLRWPTFDAGTSPPGL